MSVVESPVDKPGVLGEDVIQPALGHHFDDLEQQHDANTLGMWVFLATEVLFFGGLFTAYTVYRWLYPDAFAAASQHLNAMLGTVNTAVLLTSSLLMALAVHSARHDYRRRTLLLLLLTALLGLAFLGIKAFEYVTDYREGLIPGLNFTYLAEHGAAAEQAQAGQFELFFVLYFIMTGIHAIHLIIGILVVLVTAVLVWLRRHPRRQSEGVDMLGLYWHFVDIVWVFLFPLLYLIGLHR